MIKYRSGLPSVEDVRAHEERGGLWMIIWLAAKEAAFIHQGSANWQVIDVHDRLRPRLPDGTPCPWPGKVSQ